MGNRAIIPIKLIIEGKIAWDNSFKLASTLKVTLHGKTSTRGCSLEYLVKSLSLNARRVAEAHRIQDLILEGTNSVAKSNASGVIKCLIRPCGPVHVTRDGTLVQSIEHIRDQCNGSHRRERYAIPAGPRLNQAESLKIVPL